MKVKLLAPGYHVGEVTTLEAVNCQACVSNQGSQLALRVAVSTEGPAKPTRKVRSEITWRRHLSAIENAPKPTTKGRCRTMDVNFRV